VIHRDLKPANVMVGAFGEVQVMDWGLAKVLTESSTEQESDLDPDARVAQVTQIETPRPADSATRTGSVLGTPAYMPPEQAGGEIRKIDSRSDVFGLGAVLCKILTGHPPYEGKDANEVRLLAVRGELSDALARLDGCGAEPELVSLCKRCLAFRQEDRPADAGEVASAVAGLRGAAEERAKQAELGRAQALVREAEQRKRRRVWLGLAASLLVGLVASSLLAVWANQARKQTQRRLAQIEKGVELFAGMLSGINPRAEEQGGDGLYVQLRKRAEKAADQLDAEAVGDKLAVARLQTILGDTLRELGNAAKAVEVLEKARATRERDLGVDHPDTLISRHNLALAYQADGQLDKALPLLEATLKASEAKLGADHPETLASRNDLALAYKAAGQLDKALSLSEATLKAQEAKLGADHRDTLTSRNNLALAYEAAGQLDKALPLYEATLKAQEAKLGADHPDTLTSRNNLAMAYKTSGQLEKALPLLEATLKALEAMLGADHPNTLMSRNNLALAYRDVRQLDKALPLFQATLKAQEAKLGSDHPETLRSRNNLAVAYHDTGKLDKAVPLYEATLKTVEAKLGAEHPNTLMIRNNLAGAYQAARQLDKALALYETTLKAHEAKLGADHPNTLVSRNNLAEAYQAAGQLGKALPLLEATLKASEAKQGADHPTTLTIRGNLALAYQAARQLDKALPLFEQAAAGIEKRRFQHVSAGRTVGETAAAYEQAGQLEKAEGWRRKWLAHVRDKAGASSAAYAGELAALGFNLLRQQNWAEAERALRDCLAVREKQQPEEWTTFNTQSMLGGALLGQKKFADAEPLLLKGYAGMKERQAKIPPPGKLRLTEALERLVQLYEALDRKGEAAKWRTELEAQKAATNGG
jgi:tetratricopeptide (TPR) repeat protein